MNKSLSRSLVMLALASCLAGPATAGTLKVPSSAFPTIQSAVDAANSGDTVEVAEGIYRETVVVTLSGITLDADGAIIDAEYDDACILVSADDVVVKDFELINGLFGVEYVGNGGVIEHNVIRVCGAGGIFVHGDDARIVHNEIRGSSADGIEFAANSTASVTQIDDNTVLATGAFAIDASGGQLLVRKNRCETVSRGIRATPSHPTLESLVAKNLVTRVGADGIEANADNAALRVADNAIGPTAGACLSLNVEGTGSLVVEQNDCSAGSQGIEANGNGIVLRANQIGDCAGRGIALFGDAATIVDNEVRDNLGHGIVCYFDVTGGCTITGNEVKGNGSDGIRVTGDQHLIADNKVLRNLGDGIEILFGTGNTIRGNSCKKNAHEGIDNTGLATVIDDNDCAKNARGTGPDIAGTGKDGMGTVASFVGNDFGTGGANTPQRLDTLMFEP